MPMKLFVSAQPSALVSAYSRVVGLGYAGVLAVLALAQLFSFEAFIDILPAALYMGFGASAALVAPLIVVVEVFSLPYLLRMAVSPALRWVSLVFGWLVPLFWLGVAVIAGPEVANTGILGDVIALSATETLLLSLLMIVFAAYTHYHFYKSRSTHRLSI